MDDRLIQFTEKTEESWLLYVHMDISRSIYSCDVAYAKKLEAFNYRDKLVATMVKYLEQDEDTGNVYVVGHRDPKRSQHALSRLRLAVPKDEPDIFSAAVWASPNNKPVTNEFLLSQMKTKQEAKLSKLLKLKTSNAKTPSENVADIIEAIHEDDPTAKVIYVPLFRTTLVTDNGIEHPFGQNSEAERIYQNLSKFSPQPIVIADSLIFRRYPGSRLPHSSDRCYSRSNFSDTGLCLYCVRERGIKSHDGQYSEAFGATPQYVDMSQEPFTRATKWIMNDKVPTDVHSMVFESFMDQVLGVENTPTEELAQLGFDLDREIRDDNSSNLSFLSGAVAVLAWIVMGSVIGTEAHQGASVMKSISSNWPWISIASVASVICIINLFRLSLHQKKWFAHHKIYNLLKFEWLRTRTPDAIFHHPSVDVTYAMKLLKKEHLLTGEIPPTPDPYKNDGKFKKLFAKFKKRDSKVEKGSSKKKARKSNNTKNDTGTVDYSSVWEEIDSRHQKVVSAWLEYEMDLSKGLEFPLMIDSSEPLTSELVKAVLKAGDLKEHEKRSGDPLKSDFYSSVIELEIAFKKAEDNAKKVGNSVWHTDEQSRVQTAKNLHALVMDEKASMNERQIAHKQLYKVLEGVVVIPEKSESKMREVFALIETA